MNEGTNTMSGTAGQNMATDPAYSTEAAIVSMHAIDQSLVNELTTIIDKLARDPEHTAEQLDGRIFLLVKEHGLTLRQHSLLERIVKAYAGGKDHADR